MSTPQREKVLQILESARSIVYGQDEMLEGIVCALVSEGHLLIEGMPGLGKTLSVSTMAKLCNLEFKRVQFTPDLLPSDLIGTMVYSQKDETFKTKFGPIFTQILLADEINRSPAKVQSALLEAMAEKQVTIGDDTHKLNRPFVVLATQNPIEQEGTYELPEAQLDRFMMKLSIDYPDFESEKKIIDMSIGALSQSSLLDTQALEEIKQQVESVYVDDNMKNLIVKTIHATRPGNEFFPKKMNDVIMAGASPRASIWLYKVSKFKAYLKGKDFVGAEEYLESIRGVLGHRLILKYEAIADEIQSSDVAIDIAHGLL